MTAKRIGFWLGLAAFLATLILPVPKGRAAAQMQPKRQG